MSTLPPVPPNIEEIAAPMLLGTLWNWTLYGVLIVQVYVYSYNFPGDKKLLKLMVYSMFLVETLQTALSGADLYYWFVSGFGNIEHLATTYASPFDVPIIGSVVALTVQLFFVYRIWVLSGRTAWFICLCICLCTATDTVAAFWGGVYAHIVKKFPTGNLKTILALTWLGGNTLSDMLITTSMLYLLGKRRRDSQFSDHALSKVVRLTIETNFLTTTVGIVSLLMFAVYPNKSWFIGPTAIIGKLYSNTLLVSLNNRISMREGRGGVTRSPGVTYNPSSADSRPTAVEIMQVKLTKHSESGPSEIGSGLETTSGIFDIA